MTKPVVDTGLSVLFDLFAAFQRMKALLGEVMVDSPLRPEEYAVYSVVFELGPLTPTATATVLGMPVTTVLDHVRLMGKRGHISQHLNPADGRSYLISLTPDGLTSQRDAGRAFNHALGLMVDHLDAEPGEVSKAIKDLSQALDRARDRADPSSQREGDQHP